MKNTKNKNIENLGHVTTSCNLNIISTQPEKQKAKITIASSDLSKLENKAYKVIQLIYGDEIKLENLNYSFKTYYDFYLALIDNFEITQTPTKYPIDLRYIKEIFEKI